MVNEKRPEVSNKLGLWLRVWRSFPGPRKLLRLGRRMVQVCAPTNGLQYLEHGRTPVDIKWLQENAKERMDATLPLFDPQRRQFHLARYRFAANYSQGKRVLDCACGTGYGVRLLQEQGQAASVLGIDISRESIRYAERYQRPSGTSYVCQDVGALNLPQGSFDLITSFETIEHVPDDQAMLAHFARLLKLSGAAIISTPNNWPLEVAPFHVRTYTRAGFLSLLRPFFNQIELYNQNSGSPSPFNHGQTAGILATTEANADWAECYIAVCRQPLQPKATSTPHS